MRRNTLLQLLMAGDALNYVRAVLDVPPDRYAALVDDYPPCLRDEHRELLHAGFREMTENRSGEVYVCTHTAWPGLVKIGCTRKDAAARVAGLSGAGVIGAHTLLGRWSHFDAYRLEALVHRALSHVRQPQTEWFCVKPDDAFYVIERVRGADAERAATLLQA